MKDFGWSVVIAIFALALIISTVILAAAHEAIPTAAQPKGWTYPGNCCSGVDCREVGMGAQSNQSVKVLETDQGYQISTTGEVIAYGDTKIKDSPDGVPHWCSTAGKNDGKTICLFVPPRGF